MPLLLGALAWWQWSAVNQWMAPRLTTAEVNKAIAKALEERDKVAPTARAINRLAPSVVRVESYERKSDERLVDSGVGTGVVINRQGMILTSLHVVAGVDKIEVSFADGSRSEATIMSVRPEQDLAVLRAEVMPEAIPPAVLKASSALHAGQPVVAIGFPFGVGPSASAGVVSGLERSFYSPEGKYEIKNLIQFDAAANPGNSGGPLATLDGEVVGIVAGILNPTRHRTFVGIGFAVPIETAATAAGLPPF
ncbi:hypothetical protein NBRC116584_16500 [Hydrogenophaga sp. 5NK40-0174]